MRSRVLLALNELTVSAETPCSEVGIQAFAWAGK